MSDLVDQRLAKVAAVFLGALALHFACLASLIRWDLLVLGVVVSVLVVVWLLWLLLPRFLGEAR